MPQATIFPKRSPKDVKAALSALVRLWLDQYADEEAELREADYQCVYRFINRVDRPAPAGEKTDA